MTRPRKLYVKSYGCQMNVYDSHRMADTLAPEGFVETGTPEDADLVILNTCHIRENATEKHCQRTADRVVALQMRLAPDPCAEFRIVQHRTR